MFPDERLAVWFVSAVGNVGAGSGHTRSMEPDDGVLWSRARIGDVDAFGVVFERHADTIYNYCFRWIGDWASAEDLLAIVFLEAWRRREKELPADKILPWLYGIATNVVRNEWRSRRRYAAALRRLPHPRGEQATGYEAGERLEDERQMKHVRTLLDQLPRREQEVFALCAWFDLSYGDAAVALGVPVGTVRSRLSRARKRLRELAPDFGHEENSDLDPSQELAES